MKKDIYIITNDINDKIYVGQSVNTKERFSKHISDAIHNRDNMLIHKAIRKYGKEHFTCAILEHRIENYNEREQYWIQRLNTLQPNGYNIAIGGAGIGAGIESPMASIKSEDVLFQIRTQLRDTNTPMEKIAKTFGVGLDTITGINTGKYYKDSNVEYPIRESRIWSKDICKQLVYALRYELDKSLIEIAKEYNIDYSQLSKFNNGQTHYMAWVQYPIRISKEIKVEEVVEKIIDDLLNSQLSQKEIAKRYNVSAMTVSNINTGKRHEREDLIYPLRNWNNNGIFTCLSPDLVQVIRNDLKFTKISMNKIGEKYEVPSRTVAGINNGAIKKYRDENIKYPIR